MTEFVPEMDLDYHHQATPFVAGAGLPLDVHYRRAHLPLVAPEHPDVIADDPGHGYRMGRHATTWSLVLPLPWDLLAASPGFRAFDSALRASPIARKVDWNVFDARRPVLHATICGSLSEGDPLVIQPRWREAIAAIPAFEVRWQGLFSGSLNRGRLYIKVYPETRNGLNCIQQVQSAIGRKPTALYVAGLYNLTDHLDAHEAAWLAGFLADHRDTPVATQRVEHLWIQGVRDDLALDSEVAEILLLR